MQHLKKMKPIGWLTIGIILIISFFIIFIFVDHKSFASKKSLQAKGIHPEYTFKEISVDEELSNYPGLHLHTTLENKDTHSIAINYPFANIEDIDTPIVDWVSEQKESFLEEIDAGDSNRDKRFSGHLNIQIETNTIAEGTYNVILSAYHYTGEANGHTYKQSFTFDLNKEKIITLNDIFTEEKETVLTDYVYNQIKEIINSNKDYKEMIDQDALKESVSDLETITWGITKKSLNIYFDEYEVGPGTLGPLKFNIPIDALDAFISEDWLETFELAEEIAIREKRKEEARQQEEAEAQNHGESTLDPNDDKYIALTFDDGPHPDVTPRILDTLNDYNAKATFFMLGLQAEYYPTLAKEVANQGHEIANHSYSHTDLTLLGYDQLLKEIVSTNKQIEHATGKKPTLFRPPYGSYNNQVQNIAQQHGLSIILWSVDSLDWKNRDRNQIYSTVTANATVGSTVLLHDIHPTTADALPNVLETLSAQGYQFVTVSELMHIQGKSGVGPF